MIHGTIKPLFNTPINWGHPLAQGLVASYLFNEGCGDLVHDSCGMNDGKMINMAPMSGTSGWVPGPHGCALAFDGSNDYVETPNLANYLPIGNADRTIIALVNLQNYSYYNAFVYWGEQIPLKMNLFYSMITTGNLTFASNANDLQSDTPVPIGVWSQAAATISKGNAVVLYLNRVAVKSGTLGSAVNTTATAISIGRRAPGDLYFPGQISTVSIYNRALSAEEIAYLYAFPWCMYDQATPAWTQKDYGREARLANYYRQMRAA